MRISIPDFESKKGTFDYLVKNKKSLIAKKKMGIVKSDPFYYSPAIIPGNGKTSFSVKEEGDVQPADIDTLRVKVVANTANWIDSHMDMILEGAATKSIKERKHIIPHLYDHNHSVMAEVGDVVDIYPQKLHLRELGIDKEGSTESIIFVSDVKKSYNEKVFDRYKKGKATQHSIGLQYVKLELAVNDKDYEKEYDFFKKYYDLAINQEIADQYGYFWVVSEYKLIENSVVLFGSNELTGTLEVEGYEKTLEPSSGHSKEKEASPIVRLAQLINN